MMEYWLWMMDDDDYDGKVSGIFVIGVGSYDDGDDEKQCCTSSCS